MKNITNKQKKILDYIEFFIQVKGYPPSMREIMNFFGLKSVSTVFSHLKSLEKKGYIEISGNPRGISIKDNKKYGIIELNGELINGDIILYDNLKYIKCNPNINIKSSKDLLILYVKSDYLDYEKNTIIILKGNSIIGTLKLKEVIIDENIYWF
ncbi:hypothetical protein [Marinitoga sp. 38H-ov]|uniref:LexA family protein n=1 Tax=Marinitoga sp. 38H-ov TaxID=1755814 RepID=UPI0013EC6B33|nr:hypothetical protein [Marinitoga sp. 38H-ov]KAF2955907.1 hypothetical protein AS160_08485 [Marinitoga sp. 38H-ov]